MIKCIVLFWRNIFKRHASNFISKRKRFFCTPKALHQGLVCVQWQIRLYSASHCSLKMELKGCTDPEWASGLLIAVITVMGVCLESMLDISSWCFLLWRGRTKERLRHREGKKQDKKSEMKRIDERGKRRKLRQWKCKHFFLLKTPICACTHAHTHTHTHIHTYTHRCSHGWANKTQARVLSSW